ncbi:MAG: peptidylprolyl isomerase [Bacteroidota bacterium]
MTKVFWGLSALILVFSSCKTPKYADIGDGVFADIQTTQGDILVKLHHNATPVTVANFVSLAEGNNPFVSEAFKEKKFYDGLIFHRVIKDFMIQGGDPEGSGRGNPGYKFKDEIVDSLKHTQKGLLSMANSGPKTNGSQFFITHKPTPWLDGKHTVFGEVIQGMEVVDTIAAVKTIAQDRPEVDVVMNKVEIIRNGKEGKQFDAVQIMTDYFAEEERIIAAKKQLLEDMAAEFAAQKGQAEETESGLRILKITEGTGAQPNIGQTVMVNYAGYFESGDLFDSCIKAVAQQYGKYDARRDEAGQYGPIPMLYSPEAPLVAGFKEGLQTMKVGDKVRLFIPPHLGYGDNAYGPIPGGSTLIFDLEITGIQ